MNADAALDLLVSEGRRLGAEFGFPWNEPTQQAVCALGFLRMRAATKDGVSLVGVVGGASSGKSTVFNNLLDGRRVSLVTIRSHATRGLILAVHEAHRDHLDRWLNHDRALLPTLTAECGQLDGDLEGHPEAATVVHHTTAALRDVILVDTPDFTSNIAEREGDITLSLLPWFDRLIVMVDHERWYDRQVVDHLASLADRFGQERLVVFNRTAEHELAEADRRRLDEQARQLSAAAVCILNYHRGRGFRRFSPDTLREVLGFVARPLSQRGPALQKAIAAQAVDVLEVNRGRKQRLERLRQALAGAARRHVPATRWDCITAMMSPEERDRLGHISRVLGLAQMREWLGRQRRWLEGAIPRLPWLRPRRCNGEADALQGDPEAHSREQCGRDWFTAQCERQVRLLNEEAAGSEFWEDLRRTAGRPAFVLGGEVREALAPRVDAAIAALSEALARWDDKVRNECCGLSPQIVGGLGMTILAVSAILVAVPGPVAALTPVVAAGALKAGLLKVGAAGVFGTVSGRPLARLMEIIRERLLASPEFNQVRDAAEPLRRLVEEHAQTAADRHVQAAREMVLAPDDPLARALEAMK